MWRGAVCLCLLQGLVEVRGTTTPSSMQQAVDVIKNEFVHEILERQGCPMEVRGVQEHQGEDLVYHLRIYGRMILVRDPESLLDARRVHNLDPNNTAPRLVIANIVNRTSLEEWVRQAAIYHHIKSSWFVPRSPKLDVTVKEHVPGPDYKQFVSRIRVAGSLPTPTAVWKTTSIRPPPITKTRASTSPR